MLEWLRDLGANGLFNLAAGTASIISLFISAYVAYRVSQIRNQALLNARAGQFIRAFKRHAASISGMMQNYGEMESEILLEIATCNAALHHLKRATSGNTRALALEAIQQISLYRGGRAMLRHRSGEPSKDRLQHIHRCLLELMEDLKHTEADRRWRV